MEGATPRLGNSLRNGSNGNDHGQGHARPGPCPAIVCRDICELQLYLLLRFCVVPVVPTHQHPPSRFAAEFRDMHKGHAHHQQSRFSFSAY